MEHLSQADRGRAIAALLTAVVLFGSAFVGIRAVIGANAFTAGQLTAFRLLVAAVLLGVVVAFRGGLRVPKGRDWLPFIYLGVFGQAFYQVILGLGERTVDGGTAALLVSCSPIVASVLAVAFLGERLTWQGWVGTGIAFAGAGVIASSAGVSIHMNTGVLLVLGATLLWASYQVVQKTVAAGYSPLELTAWPTWIAVVALIPWIIQLPKAIATAPLSASMAAVYLGAFSSVAGFLAWSYAIRRLPVVVSSNALFAVPVAAAIVGWLVLGETPAPLALVGAAVVISGVALMQLKGRPARVGEPVATAAEPAEA